MTVRRFLEQLRQDYVQEHEHKEIQIIIIVIPYKN
jgi:hypothetical protein